jgi:hypothetical protein
MRIADLPSAAWVLNSASAICPPPKADIRAAESRVRSPRKRLGMCAIGHKPNSGDSNQCPRLGDERPWRCRISCFPANPLTLWYFAWGHVMRRGFYSVFLPVGAILFLLAYVFLINPDALPEFGRWLQNSQFGPWLEKFL